MTEFQTAWIRLASAALLFVSLALPAHSQTPSGLSSDNRALLARAEQGNAQAQLELAAAYHFGNGAPSDDIQALRWYQAAGEKGLGEAQNGAGSILMKQRKFSDAYGWFEKAAAQNHLQALNSQAFLLDTGQGVSQNRQRALELYTRAANRGWAESMWNLANFYGVGLPGAKPDYVTSCAWALRSARYATDENSPVHGNVEKVMPVFERLLTDDQKRACQTQGDEWFAPDAPRPKEKK